jgi:transposase
VKLAFELGSSKWTLGFTTAPAQRARLRPIVASDVRALEKEIVLAKARFGLPVDARVQSCDEADRDGVWLHRWLTARGVENVVVESSSIEVNRLARRAKTDRLDVGKLLALLLRWLGGERKVWSGGACPVDGGGSAATAHPRNRDGARGSQGGCAVGFRGCLPLKACGCR